MDFVDLFAPLQVGQCASDPAQALHAASGQGACLGDLCKEGAGRGMEGSVCVEPVRVELCVAETVLTPPHPRAGFADSPFDRLVRGR